MDVTTASLGAGPINADGSVTVAGREDIAYNHPPGYGSLRAIAAAVWLVVATDRGPARERDVAVTAWPGMFEIIVAVRVRAWWLWPRRRAALLKAAQLAAATALPPGRLAEVHVLERWRPLPVS